MSAPEFVYHIYPLGALGAERLNPGGLSPLPRLQALEGWIPHWQALGIDTILLGPLFDSESHGYDTRDMGRIDPRLGTGEDLKKFLSALKKAGFKVLFDGVFNHTGRSFFAFQELLAEGGLGRRSSWYKDVRPSSQGFSGTPFSYRGWNGHGTLPELNLASQEVRSFLRDSVSHWIEEYRIDGLRLDAADVLDFDFMKELSDFCRQKRPDFWLLGEVIHGEYRRWTETAGLDSVTNYELYKSLWSSLKDRNFYELTWTLGRQFGPQGLCRNFQPLTFLDNHDVSRLASVLTDGALRDLAWQLSFLLPGIPSLYYGSEWDWEGTKGQGEDWNLRPRCFPGDQFGKPSRVSQLKALSDLRKKHPVLVTGSLEKVANTHRQLAFLRRGPGGILVLVNASENSECWSAGIGFDLSHQIWGQTSQQPEAQKGIFHMPPSSVLVYTLC